jgi:alkylation response protein AidB-like acyl-CoA dehydrogenase
VAAVDTARSLFAELDAAGAAAAPGSSFDRSALRAVVDAGLYGASAPREVGGLDLPLVEVVDVWAELARADGSIGWCTFASDVALAYFGAYLPDAGTDIVFADGLPILAGQFAPNGTARRDGDDWVVDGEYQFGSGMTLADRAGCGFLATPPGGGDPAYLFGCFPATEIEPKGNWDVLGLRGTMSIDYGVHGVRVPDVCTFDFFAPTVHRGSAMHHLGVLPLTAAGHAAWALGVTRRTLDELVAVAGRVRMGAPAPLAESEHVLISYARLESRWAAGRAWVREVCAQAEAEAAARGGPPEALTADRLRQACVHVNREGADIAREAYLLAGTAALREGPLQRCFRDLHAGAQHFFASSSASIDWARGLLARS